MKKSKFIQILDRLEETILVGMFTLWFLLFLQKL